MVPTPSSAAASITASDIIAAIQAVILVVTVIIMIWTSHRANQEMRRQLLELQRTTRSSAHSTMFERLFELYGLFLQYPADLKTLWPQLAGEPEEKVRSAYLGYALIDLLYLMHLEWSAMDPGLQQTWNVWASRLVQNEFLSKLLSQVENEYPADFVKRLRTIANNKHIDDSTRTHGGR